MKNYTKETFLELLRKTDFPDYITFTCLNKAYQEFIFKLREVIDLFCPSKKLRLKADSKAWIDFETISTILRRDKPFKKYKNLVSKQTKIISDWQKWLSRKLYLKKRNLFFKKKSKRMLIILKNYGKLLSL